MRRGLRAGRRSSPQRAARCGVEAEELSLAAVGARGLDEESPARNDRRRVADSPQRQLPEDAVALLELRGDVLVGGDAGAVGPAKARPVGRGGGGNERYSGDGDDEEADGEAVHGGGVCWRGASGEARGDYRRIARSAEHVQ